MIINSSSLSKPALRDSVAQCGPWSSTSHHEEGRMVDSSKRKGCGEPGLVEGMVAALELGEEGVERRSLPSDGRELVGG